MIKDIPKYIRPREKGYRIGVENLSDTELLAILIQSGTKEKSAIQIAEDLLNNYKSIYGVLNLSFEQLLTIRGISKVKAIQLKTVKELFVRYCNDNFLTNEIIFNNTIDVFNYVKFKINNVFQERVIVLYMNMKNKLLFEQIISIGDDNASLLNNKLICKMAIEKYAKKIIICHNHPSDKTDPSIDDINSYFNLKDALKLFDIKLLDSLIICNNKFYSISNEKEYIVS